VKKWLRVWLEDRKQDERDKINEARVKLSQQFSEGDTPPREPPGPPRNPDN
jgi:hypothetical protein